jgi:signal transduction histidine kinase/MFS family permease
MFTWEKVLFLLSIGTIGSLGAFVLVRGRKDMKRITFSVLLFSFAALALSICAVRIAASRSFVNALDLVGRLSFAMGGLTCGAFLAFTEVFPGQRRRETGKSRLLTSYGVGIAAAATALTPWFWRGVRLVEGEFTPVFGWGVFLWAVFLLFALAAGLTNLISGYRGLPKGHLKNQVRYTFLGFAILAFPAAIFSILLPSFGNVSYTSLVPFFGTLTAIVITYALVRHRLMDLGIVFRNTLVYSSLISSVAALMIGFHVLFSSALGFPSTLSVLFAAGAVAAGFEPLKRRQAYLIDQYIFKGRYDYRKVVVEFGETVSRILDLSQLEKCIVDRTVEIMRAENGLILAADARFEEYRTEYAYFTGTHLPLDRILLPGNALLEELRRTKKVIVEQEIRRTRTKREADPLLQELGRLRSAIVIPLISKGKLLGMLSLGEKKSGDIYSAEDVSLLTVLGNQVAPSLENSRLFNEILLMKNHQDNILQHLRSGVVTVDANSRVKSANRSAARILKRTRRDLLWQDVSVLGKGLGRLALQRLQDGFGHFEGEIRADVSEKGNVPLGVVATTMAGEKDGREVLLVFDDLSEVKLLQERIRRADRLAVVGTFAAGMAHEIKNPLVPLKTFSQLLPEMFDDQEFRNRFSVLVLKEVERINQIIEKLLNFARPMQPVLAPCDMHELIDEVLLLLEEDFRKNRIELRRRYTNEGARITVDRQQIKQVLLNLFLNAVQAVASDGTVDVTTAYVWERSNDGDARPPRAEREEKTRQVSPGDDDKVRKFQIKISDTGCGIAEKDLKHLFDPFFTTKPEGTGLGLAISHVIVEEHGGTLDAESEEGKGATFTLTFPTNNNA